MNDFMMDAYAAYWLTIEADATDTTPKEVLDAYAEFDSVSND